MTALTDVRLLPLTGQFSRASQKTSAATTLDFYAELFDNDLDAVASAMTAARSKASA